MEVKSEAGLKVQDALKTAWDSSKMDVFLWVPRRKTTNSRADVSCFHTSALELIAGQLGT